MASLFRSDKGARIAWLGTGGRRREQHRRPRVAPQVAEAGLPAGARAVFRLHQVREDVVDPGQVALALGPEPSEDPRVKAHGGGDLASRLEGTRLVVD